MKNKENKDLMNNQLDESELENVVGGYRNQIINGKEFTGAIRGRCLMIGRCYYATSNDRDVWAYGRILDREGASRNAFNYGDVKKCEYTMQIMFTSDESVIPQSQAFKLNIRNWNFWTTGPAV